MTSSFFILWNIKEDMLSQFLCLYSSQWSPVLFGLKKNQNIFFCVLQKKASHSDLELHEGGLIVRGISYWVNYPFQ